jgi:hypothetical protein
MEEARTSETSVDNYFIRQYIPEDNSDLGLSYTTSVAGSNLSQDTDIWSRLRPLLSTMSCCFRWTGSGPARGEY